MHVTRGAILSKGCCGAVEVKWHRRGRKEPQYMLKSSGTNVSEKVEADAYVMGGTGDRTQAEVEPHAPACHSAPLAEEEETVSDTVIDPNWPMSAPHKPQRS